ncbi:ADP-ribosylglycohydrolase family protein [Shewanella sp. Scap07]|nr:ADP-ribosylglycohydrolase family protein [Shewanella sp. Scap07]
MIARPLPSVINLTVCAVVLLASLLLACSSSSKVTDSQVVSSPAAIEISRRDYKDKLYGFWLGQSIANWTGLVTEMDKIGGAGPHGVFYTREDWGKADQPSIWGQGVPSDLSATIDFVFKDPGEVWGSDDDTDIEYIYQHLLDKHQTSILTAEQIRDGWLTHIYSESQSPFGVDDAGKAQNYLWVSNQRAYDLMAEHDLLPPSTSDPANNPEFEMIDAQLTTEIFGLFAPTRPDVALNMAYLPIRTTARENAAWAAEFYVIMHALAAGIDPAKSIKPQLFAIADQARQRLPNSSYTAKMYDFVKSRYLTGARWETVRDELYVKYQLNQEDGYDITAQQRYCNGCFASGINFAASLVSFFYGEADIVETIKIASLAGWDSDNPAATWGGLLGFVIGKQGIEAAFDRQFADQFNIHRTRGGFDNNGIDNFADMAAKGVGIVDHVVIEQLGGSLDTERQVWRIPQVNGLGFDTAEPMPY